MTAFNLLTEWFAPIWTMILLCIILLGLLHLVIKEWLDKEHYENGYNAALNNSCFWLRARLADHFNMTDREELLDNFKKDMKKSTSKAQQRMTTNEKKRSQSESLATMAKAFGCMIFDTGYQSAIIDTAEWLEEHAKLYGIDTANLKALLCNYKQVFDPE